MDHFADQKPELEVLLPELTFVNDVEAKKHQCDLCRNIAVYHYRADCEHLFCRSCYVQIRNNPCPISRCSHKSVLALEDESFEQSLKQLKVFCVNHKYGCMTTVSLADILVHKKRCSFTKDKLLPRLYNPDKDWMTTIWQLEKNLNERIDQKSSEIISEVFAKLQENVTKISAMMEKSEQNLTILVHQMNGSTSDDQMKKINDDNVSMQHLDVELKVQNTLERYYQQILEENSVTQSWTVYSINSKLKDLKRGELQTISSKIFKPHKYEMRLQVHLKPNLKEKCFGIFLTFLDNQQNTWYRVHVNLQDRVNKRDVWRVIDTAFETRKQLKEMEMWGLQNFAPMKFFEKDSPYVKNDSVRIKITLIPCFILNKYVFLDEGILLWKFERYCQKMTDQMDGVSDEWQSLDFYTSKSGYKLQIWLNFTETGVEFSQTCLKGSFDENLSSKFSHKTILQIFDQTQNGQKRHLEKSVESKKTSHKIGEFNYNEIENERHLRNDCLIIKVTVKPKISESITKS